MEGVRLLGDLEAAAHFRPAAIPAGALPSHLGAALFAVVAYLGLLGVATYLLMGIGGALLSVFVVSVETASTDLLAMLGATSQVVGVLIVTWVFCRFVHHASLSGFGIRLRISAVAVLLLLVTGSLASLVRLFALTGAENIVAHIGEVAIINPERLQSIVLVNFASVFLEEIAFRVYVLQIFEGVLNTLFAIVISSVAFGLLHLAAFPVGVFELIGLACLGVVLGLIFLWSRNVWYPFAFHLGWNLSGEVIVRGSPDPRMYSYGIEVLGVTVVALAISTVAAYSLQSRACAR